MVHDEKVTVPLLTKTPPCKHTHKICENPIGAMGTSARTYPAELPVMVHDEKVTVPLQM